MTIEVERAVEDTHLRMLKPEAVKTGPVMADRQTGGYCPVLPSSMVLFCIFLAMFLANLLYTFLAILPTLPA